MGNIYFEQKKYSSAIKMYRMALDQVWNLCSASLVEDKSPLMDPCCFLQIPSTAKEVRFKIMRNIGLSFVRMGQYQDALQVCPLASASCQPGISCAVVECHSS